MSGVYLGLPKYLACHIDGWPATAEFENLRDTPAANDSKSAIVADVYWIKRKTTVPQSRLYTFKTSGEFLHRHGAALIITERLEGERPSYIRLQKI